MRNYGTALFMTLAITTLGATPPQTTIHPGDQLSVQVYGDKDLTQTVTVLPDGSIVYPLFEGAGLIVIGTGCGTVYGWGGPPFSGFAVIGGRADYLLGIPQVPTANAVANLLSIVADGQIGFSAYTADRRLALKSTTINGVIVAGAGSATLPNSILNGDLAAPSPRLFDVALIDIGSVGMFATSSAVPGFPAAMAIRMDAKNDCLTLIAHVLEIH